ncbi:MAG TPA: NAD-binding protein, partial [Chromatiaceae bacterium]|nr:NAD-binding protein [Chromatiaceae bacterium]
MILNLSRSTQRLLLFLVALPATMLVMATVYMLGMEHLEGAPRTFLESLQWASETITTTGYGNDSHWQHPVFALFVILGQIMGQFLVFLIFPIFLLPYLEERFQTRLPRQLPVMTGKVLFHRFGPAIETLLEEFRRTATPFVIYEENLQLAQALRDQGYMVVYGNLAQNPAVLAKVVDARAVVTLADDHANAHCTLLAREYGFTGQIFALAREPLYRAPMLRMGATDVFTPAHVLGGALAARASQRISPPAEGLHLLGTRIALTEFRLHPASPLAGQRLGDLHLRQRHGVTLIGQWHGGRFTTPQGPDTPLQAGAILVVVGAPEHLERLERLAMPIRRQGPCIVAGFGVVGFKVAQMLHDVGETCTVIDFQAFPGVDILGNVLELGTLQRARVREASAVILALSDDSETIFAAAAIRDYAPEVPLIVRVSRARNTERIYRAGADFAISEGEVAGQILAYHLLGEHLIPVDHGIRISRLDAGALAGSHPWRDEVRERSGANIVAVVRDAEVLIDFPDDFLIQPEDNLLVCGTFPALERFQQVFRSQPC